MTQGLAHNFLGDAGGYKRASRHKQGTSQRKKCSRGRLRLISGGSDFELAEIRRHKRVGPFCRLQGLRAWFNDESRFLLTQGLHEACSRE